MVKSLRAFSNVGFEANLRGSGENMYQSTNLAITQGFEKAPISFDKPGGLYAFGKASVGNQLYYSTNMTLNPTRATINEFGAGLTGGLGLNRTGPGVFAGATAEYKFGTALHSTDLMNTATSFQGDLGFRKLSTAPTDGKKAVYEQHGVYTQFEQNKKYPDYSDFSTGYKYEISQGDKSLYGKFGLQTNDGKTFGGLVGVGGKICFSAP